jgi:hypothetical protein
MMRASFMKHCDDEGYFYPIRYGEKRFAVTRMVVSPPLRPSGFCSFFITSLLLKKSP